MESFQPVQEKIKKSYLSALLLDGADRGLILWWSLTKRMLIS